MVIPTCTFNCKYYDFYFLFTYFNMFIIWSNFSEDMVMVCSAFAASPPPSPLDYFFFFFGVFSFASLSDELDLSEETDFLHFFSFLSLLVVWFLMFSCTQQFPYLFLIPNYLNYFQMRKRRMNHLKLLFCLIYEASSFLFCHSFPPSSSLTFSLVKHCSQC